MKFVVMVALGSGVLGGCSNQVDQPQEPADQGIPAIGSLAPTFGVQCKAEILNQEGQVVTYKNVYFTTDSSGAETIVSQSQGTTPCP